jgi:hypothetical protein
MTRAIHIDPETRIVKQMTLGPNLQDICTALDSETIIALYPVDDRDAVDHILYVDDSVLYREPEDVPEAFQLRMFGERFIYGKAVLVCYRPDGAMRLDVEMSYQILADQVWFCDRDEALTKLIQKRKQDAEYFFF